MNNQFSGPNAWDQYLSALEDATPVIQALAVTDYYVTDTYAEVRRQKDSGRLPNVDLIFPNVELRLDAATARGSFVNIHLLVSPEEPNHVEELHRLLMRLQFNAYGDCFDCTRPELIRLGKKANPSILEDRAALSFGATQYKVNFQRLREVYQESDWAKKNILIAVAGGASDGTSGVRGASDQTIRREIEGFAHIIFASSEAQRDFWLGNGRMSRDDVRSTYRGLKPCLHGSDAHSLQDVGLPFGDRFSWIKGGVEFDSLRQACIDPAGRAHIGAGPPTSATPSQVISHVEILNSPWMTTPIVPLNSGLVAIIGARGSGKTALADMIAAGCDSISAEAWSAEDSANPSFLARARDLIDRGKVKVSWASGAPSLRSLNGVDSNDPASYSRVRYLSQQFVEELCSSSGLTDGLLREIERVIFESHTEQARGEALDFAELLESRASRYRLARRREAEAVSQISERISIEIEKQKLLTSYETQVLQKQGLINAYTADRSKLVSVGSEARAQRHMELADAANLLRGKLRKFNAQRQTLLALQDEVSDLRRNRAPESLRQTQARHPQSGLSAKQWEKFLLDYKGPVDADLAGHLQWVDAEIVKIRGVAPPQGDPKVPHFSDDTDLRSVTQSVIEAEMARLEKLVNADQESQRRYAALSNKIATENAGLVTLNRPEYSGDIVI